MGSEPLYCNAVNLTMLSAAVVIETVNCQDLDRVSG
jgi:hypothetical protein